MLLSSLKHFPILCQLSDVHEDNKEFDCVPTCVAACLQYLTGKAYDAAVIKDTVYGTAYVGGTAAAAYVAYCRAQGVLLEAIDGTPSELTAQAHRQLAAGCPVIFTEVDPYAPASRGWTHCCCWHADSGEELTALDPYIGKDITRTDGEWQAVLRENQIWRAYLEDTNDMAITINSPGVAAHFVEVAQDRWHCPAKKLDVAYGMLAEYKATNGLLTLGLPVSGEIPVEQINPPLFARFAGHGITVQFFERGVLVYDVHHLIDNPPGSGDVYRAHIDAANSPGLDPRLWTVNLPRLLQAK